MLVIALSAQNDLFFSEYIEGSSNNKCIELFNPTDQDIVLDGIYRLRIYFNGAADGQTLRNLEGRIPAKGTFVLCNGLTDIPRDAAFAAGPNGDDILILEKNNLPLDIFGNIGCVEGDQWTNGIIGTKDMTLVRKSCINKGVTIDPSDCDFPTLYTEWIAYPIDDLSHLGSHLFEEVAAEIIPENETCKNLNNGKITINPTSGVSPYVYSINDLRLQNSNEFLNLIPATYQIYIEDAQGCDFTESVVIKEGIILSVAIESLQEMLCENETLLLSTPDTYTDYNWSNNMTTPEISIDTAGVYTLVVTDEMGCTAMEEITINLIPQDTIRLKEQTCDPEQLQQIITTNLETDGCQDVIITSYELIQKDTTYLNNTTCNSIDAGTSSELFSNYAGCDSLVITTITLLASDTIHSQQQDCDVLNVGFDTLRYSNHLGCDSVLIVETVLDSNTDLVVEMRMTCDASSLENDTLVLQNILGCDSVIVTEYSLLQSDTIRSQRADCDVTKVGFDTLRYSNHLGCDSVLIVETILDSNTDLIVEMRKTCDASTLVNDTLVLQNILGCDSVIVTEYSLLQSDTIRSQRADCDVAKVGFDTLRYSNHLGCDSVVIVETILDANTDLVVEMRAICDPSRLGNDTLVLQNILGCDSVIVTEYSLLQSDTIRSQQQDCDVTKVGFDTLRYSNYLGCDSVLIVETVLDSNTDLVVELRETCDASVLENDTLVLQNMLGCDSIIVTEYSLNPTDTNYINQFVTERDMIGIDSLNLINQFGCDSLVIIEFLFAETPIELVYIKEATCNPEEIGIDTLFLKNIQNYDSLVVITTSLLPSDTSYFQIQDCDTSQVGMEMVILMNQHGCDSVLLIETVLSDNKNIATQNVFTCDPNQVLIDTLFFKNINGCDSLVIRTNNYLPPDTTYLQQQDCDPNNIGTEMVLLSNQYGCDSILVLTTVLLVSDTTYLNQFTTNQNEVRIDSMYFTNQYGCDSLVIQEITYAEEPIDLTYLIATSCDENKIGVDTLFFSNIDDFDSLIITTTTLVPSDTIFIKQFTSEQEAVGLDSLLFSNRHGCDSLVITEHVFQEENVAIHYIMESSCNQNEVGVDTVFLRTDKEEDSLVIITTTLLPSDTIYVNEITFDSTTIGKDSLLLSKQNGCDSLVITERIYEMPTTATRIIRINTCDSEEVGIDTLFISNGIGIDSTIITIVTLLTSDTIALTEITFDLSASGIDSIPLTNQYGCDSLVIIETIFQAPAIDITQLEASTCEQSFVGIDTTVLKNRLGFDSLIITRTTLLPSDTIYLSQQSCIENNVGIKEELLMNQYGCDSLLIIETIQREGTIHTIETTTCDINQVGKDTLYLSTIDGCDSVVITNRSLLQNDFTMLTQVSCNPSDITTIIDTFTNQYGCDSIVQIQIQLAPPEDCRIDFTVTTDTICPNETNGKIWIEATFGKPPFLYTILKDRDTLVSGKLERLAEQLTLLNLSAGNYFIELKNDLGVIAQQEIQLEAYPSIELSFTTSDYNGYPISCVDATDGSIEVNFKNDNEIKNFRWSNGSTSPTIENIGAGGYTMTVFDSNNCVHIENIEMTAPLPLEVELSTTAPLCFGEELGQVTIQEIRNNIGIVDFSLDGALFDPLPDLPFTIDLSPNTYPFVIQDENDCQSITVFDIIEAEEQIIELGEDRTLTLGDEIQIRPTANFEIFQYEWTADVPIIGCTDCHELDFQPIESGTYRLTAFDENDCRSQDEITLLIEKNNQIYLPTAFSPNGDGLNDDYRVYLGKAIKEILVFQIADERGHLLYEVNNLLPNNYAIHWDGTFKGKPLPTDTYVTFVKVLLIDGEKEQIVQTFNLLR